MTNGDKIRSMSDEELLEFLISFESLNSDTLSLDTLCTSYEDTNRCLKFNEKCDSCLMAWLREEVTADG